jgi:hypothetical protein
MIKIGFDRWIELVLATAIAGATIWNVCVATRQWSVMNETNQINTRPYIKIELIPESFAVNVSPSPGGSAGIIMQFAIENTGKLPAPADIQGSILWSGRSHQKGQWSFNNLGKRFLFPSQDSVRFIAYAANELTPGELLDLKGGGNGNSLYVSAMVLYGPDAQHLGDRATRICTQYPFGFTDGQFKLLAVGEPCTDPDSNYAR